MKKTRFESGMENLKKIGGAGAWELSKENCGDISTVHPYTGFPFFHCYLPTP